MRHSDQSVDYDATVSTNLTTAFAIVRAAVKAGVAGLARSAAATYAGRNIRVNAVAPGLVTTAATKRIIENDKALEASLKLHPLGRIAKPEQIARLIVWLLDSANDWMTGQVIQLDGGLSSLKVPR